MAASRLPRWPRCAAVLIAALFGCYAPAAMAQTTMPNPLRARPAQEKAIEKQAEPKTDAAAKPKRERSAKQKENDQIMRDCGASWRNDKPDLQAKGVTWRAYLKECRNKRKGEQKA